MTREIKDDEHLITTETEELLNDALDEVRDKVIERGGQENLDWEYHKDTNMGKISISWLIKDENDE